MTPLDYEYMAYVIEHNRQYETLSEYNNRYRIYKRNRKMVMNFNANPNRTMDVGINMFSD